MEEFFVVTINRNGMDLYINMMEGSPKWTKDIDEACVWDNDDIALKWARKHFKECQD